MCLLNIGGQLTESRKLLLTIIIFTFTINGCLSAIGENTPNTEIEPFVGKDFIKKPEGICEYDGIKAGCNQLLINLFKKDNRILTPKREDILYLKEVITIIKEHGGLIVGQIQGLGVIQVEVRSKENLLKLKKKLEGSGYVQSVDFNMVVSKSGSVP